MAKEKICKRCKNKITSNKNTSIIFSNYNWREDVEFDFCENCFEAISNMIPDEAWELAGFTEKEH